MSVNTKNMVEVNHQNGFIIKRKSDGKRVGFQLSGKSKSTKNIWSKSGLLKSAFKYHTGTYFDEQNEYEILELI